MEEILASIRRIIADDQSSPARVQEAAPTVAVVEPPPPEPTIVHVLRPAPTPESAPTVAAEPPPAASMPEPQEPAPRDPAPLAPHEVEALRSTLAPMFAAHGTIAPQFAMPDSPANIPAETHHEAVEVHHEPDAATTFPAMDQQPAVATHALPHEEMSAPEYDHMDEPEAETPLETASVYDLPLGRHEPEPFEPAPLFSAATDQALMAAFNTLAATRLADNSDDLLSMTRDMIRPLLKTWLDENLPSMVERLVRAEIERVARGGR